MCKQWHEIIHGNTSSEVLTNFLGANYYNLKIVSKKHWWIKVRNIEMSAKLNDITKKKCTHLHLQK